MKQAEEISFSIPKGVEEGMQLTISGKGNAPKGEESTATCWLLLKKKHTRNCNDGQDLIYSLFVSVTQAALGDDAEIPTIDGRAKIKIEPGTKRTHIAAER